MRRLATLAWGMLLVVLDLRINGFDLLPDPLGWVVGAVAASSLARSAGELHPGARRWFGAAAVASAVAVVPAVPDWFGVQHPMITVSVTAAETVLVFATCTAIMAVLPARRATANAVRWLDLGLSLAFAALIGAAVAVPELGVVALLIGLASLAVFVWFLVLLFRARKDDTAVPQVV
jgi:hypothetical protein